MRRPILQTGVSIDGYVAALDRRTRGADRAEDEAASFDPGLRVTSAR